MLCREGNPLSLGNQLILVENSVSGMHEVAFDSEVWLGSIRILGKKNIEGRHALKESRLLDGEEQLVVSLIASTIDSPLVIQARTHTLQEELRLPGLICQHSLFVPAEGILAFHVKQKSTLVIFDCEAAARER